MRHILYFSDITTSITFTEKSQMYIILRNKQHIFFLKQYEGLILKG